MTDLIAKARELVAEHQREMWGRAMKHDLVAVSREREYREAMAVALEWAEQQSSLLPDLFIAELRAERKRLRERALAEDRG